MFVRSTRRAVVAYSLGALVALPLLAACTDNAPSGGSGAGDADPRALSVTAEDAACSVSTATAPSGNLKFSVRNAGTQVTEFYLLDSDGLRIVAEVENIGPGLTRDLVVTAAPGRYLTACKPGMTGAGIRAPFEVSDSGADLSPQGGDKEQVAAATKLYAAYVKDQADQLLTKTEQFHRLYVAGDDAKARELYPVARVHWERIEPVAESFGDLDPKMDLREADVEEGAEWTGWHRIEKDLWPARANGYTPLTKAERKKYADDLLANTKLLRQRTQKLTLSVDKIGNGATALLDEVATGKVTGEEEYWSRTDLWDFQANVDGARVAFDGLRPILKQKDAALDTQIDQRFKALQKLLDQQKKGSGFRLYNELSKAEVKALSDAVNALSEPLSKLTAAVV
ncbi:MAG TPA: iron uptake system protein EfeO [Propionibacteriaceae bacterium]